MRNSLSLKSPILWVATVAGCLVAAYLVARAEESAPARDPDAPGKVVTPDHSSPEAHPPVGRPARSRAGSDWKTERTTPPGAWIRIPSAWMERCNHGVKSETLHRILGLEPEDGRRLQKAADLAMQEGKRQQVADIDDFVMTEGRTLHLPALDEGAIRALSSEVLAVLPEKAGPADQELLGFLMERELRREYGEALTVSLEFTGGVYLPILGPSKLRGFHYVVRKEGGDSMQYSVPNGDRLDFLKLDPSVNNEGRNPLGQ